MVVQRTYKESLKDDHSNSRMSSAVNLEFEEAARLRDEIRRLEAQVLGLAPEAAFAGKVQRASALRASGRRRGKYRRVRRGA